MNNINSDDILIKVETVQSKIIKVLFEVLKEVLLGSVNLIFTKSGIKLKTANGTEKTLAYMSLDAEKFEDYICNADEFIAGIDTSNVYKITKSIQSKDTIFLYILKSNPGHLILKRINEETSSCYNHVIKLCNVPYSNMEIPETKYLLGLVLKSTEFQVACKNLNGLNCDVINMYFTNKSIILEGENLFSKSQIEISQQQENEYDCEDIDTKNLVSPIKQGSYLLQYILLFTKATTLDKNFQIYCNPDKPLTLSYSIGSLGTIDFMLVPEVLDSDSESSDSE